jgi:hypothetical protein
MEVLEVDVGGIILEKNMNERFFANSANFKQWVKNA